MGLGSQSRDQATRAYNDAVFEIKKKFRFRSMRLLGRIDVLENTGFPLDQEHAFNVDLKRDQLETRVATLDLKLVTARARPEPHEDEIVQTGTRAEGSYQRHWKSTTESVQETDRSPHA